MLELFVPDEYVASVFDIDLEGLKKRGIEGLIIDIDNTLVSWETKTADHRILEWFYKLERMGFKACLLSNNTRHRVAKFTETIRIPAVYRAGKPRKKAFIKAVSTIGKSISNTAVIGDQIFTDVFGGKRLGLYTVLVLPVSDREFFTTRFVRKIEKRLLDRMAGRGMLVKPVVRRNI